METTNFFFIYYINLGQVIKSFNDLSWSKIFLTYTLGSDRVVIYNFIWLCPEVYLRVEFISDQVVDEEGRVGDQVDLQLHLVQHPQQHVLEPGETFI